ncbi:hypothetical protein BDZ94DRAFT_1054728 [Collybia nuda]|uniref:SH3 domain-containing protein n=1 Tax=Collybia nuda TaxID=64659 RepID=A0A9P5Y0X9_9AGAR|nr:hypothetical protein BDZ94DRAFT_1054728 [Collybia nuda]
MAPPTRARRGTNAQLQLPLGTPGTQTQLSAVARSAPRTSPSPSGSRTSFVSPNSMRSFPTTPRSPKTTAINQRDVFAREPSSTRVPLGHNRRHSSVSHGPLSPGHSAQSSLGSSGVQSELSEQMSELELEMEYIPLEAPGTESIQMSEFKRSIPLNARQLETTPVNVSFPLSERELEALPVNSRGTRAIPLTELATVFDVASKSLPSAHGTGTSRSSNESKRASRVLLDGKRGSGVWSSKVWEDAAAKARAAEVAKASVEAKAREIKAAEEAKAHEIKAAEEAKAREIRAVEQAKALAALERPRAPYKAEALFSYSGISDDPSELSFKKGEVLDVFNKSDQWWEARTADGKQGIAPSNYLKVIWRISLVESRRNSAATEARRNSNTASLRQSRRESVVDSRNSVLWDAGRDSVVIESVTHAVAADATLEPVVVPKIVINTPPTVQEVYPYKAEALHSYNGDSEDPSELSFKKGDVLDILTKSDQWWEARTASGKKGIAPSNYLRLLTGRLDTVIEVDPTPSAVASPTETEPTIIANIISEPQEVYPYKAEALFGYTASSDDSTELSFKKGELLDILTKSEQWWQARKQDGTRGIAPSNYLKLVVSTPPASPIQETKVTTPETPDVVNVSPQEVYPYKAEALHAYTASLDDPAELSFKKGEVLDILNKSEQWWEARKVDGTKGIAPSNYLKITSRTSVPAFEPKEIPSAKASTTLAIQDPHPFKAEALHSYTASPDDSTELSFKKGEVLDILTKSEQWWEARKLDGTKGIAPSNYLKEITPKAAKVEDVPSSVAPTQVTESAPQESYPYKAEALYAYTGSPDDATEVSFKKGEILDVMTKSDLWWEVRKSNGTKGIAPSNYLKVVSRVRSVLPLGTKAVQQAIPSTETLKTPTSAVATQEVYPYKAEALFAYTGSPDDQNELSFKKGEVLDILTKSDLWWEARKLDGTKGIAPSNYLKDLSISVPESTVITSALSAESVALQAYLYKAEALFNYTASPDDSTELSFKKGEILDILTKSDLWWEARTLDGTKGIAPSNFLRLIEDVTPKSTKVVQAETNETYPYKAKALFAYTASPEDSIELSFKKGELLDILTKSDLWWEARKADGTKGIAPSNYLMEIGGIAPETLNVVKPYLCKAQALHTYTASPDDSTELSFRKGEMLEIFSKSDLWWEARKADGTTGIAPSNYLLAIEDGPQQSTDIPATVERVEQAEALFAYTASPDDPTELSFRKYEVLNILSKSDIWWEARKADGTRGIVPSNYLKTITTAPTQPIDTVKTGSEMTRPNYHSGRGKSLTFLQNRTFGGKPESSTVQKALLRRTTYKQLKMKHLLCRRLRYRLKCTHTRQRPSILIPHHLMTLPSSLSRRAKFWIFSQNLICGGRPGSKMVQSGLPHQITYWKLATNRPLL